MSSWEPARTAARRPRSTIFVTLVVVGAALVGALGYRSLAASSSAARSPLAAAPVVSRPHERLPRDHHGDDHAALGEADGVLPDGVTVFDDEYPAVANLDPDLLRALREAAADAASDGVEIFLSSGWRSPAYQDQLLREAIGTYGSMREAARWVATPTTSAHVSGDAVDVDSLDTTAWLSDHGAAYGLCQIYGNEPWHFELRPAAVDRGCPPMYADPTQDPRMQG
jgi:hypothetical protein